MEVGESSGGIAEQPEGEKTAPKIGGEKAGEGQKDATVQNGNAMPWQRCQTMNSSYGDKSCKLMFVYMLSTGAMRHTCDVSATCHARSCNMQALAKTGTSCMGMAH